MLYDGESEVGVPWKDFRAKFVEFGGNEFYAAWQVVYREPFMRDMAVYGKGCPLQCPLYQRPKVEWDLGLCPAAESVQPRLMQLPTNYETIDEAKVVADALAKTIDYYKHTVRR